MAWAPIRPSRPIQRLRTPFKHDAQSAPAVRTAQVKGESLRPRERTPAPWTRTALLGAALACREERSIEPAVHPGRVVRLARGQRFRMPDAAERTNRIRRGPRPAPGVSVSVCFDLERRCAEQLEAVHGGRLRVESRVRPLCEAMRRGTWSRRVCLETQGASWTPK